MSAQTRCCVVCSRSSPKTIFSCRYKVHQRNVEVLRTYFKRELDFGELCDRCYRLWYKHKRAKKEPTNTTTQNVKNTRKRKSITDITTPTSPAGIDPPKYTTNGYMTRIESSGSGPLQYPPFKKYKNNYEVEYNGLHMSSVQMEHMSGHSYFQHQDEEECIVEESTTVMNNDDEDDQHERRLAQIRLQEQQDNEILEEITNTLHDEQQEERELSLLDTIKVITQAPRISKRKPMPLKSPLKLDPVYEHVVCTNHAHKLLNKQNEFERNCVNNEQIEETVTA